jgi:hypothetical protein
MHDKPKDGRAALGTEGMVITTRPLSPEEEAVHLLHELMHAQVYAMHSGQSSHLVAMNERWHEFCLAHPDIAEKYGYDPKTQTWVVKIDQKLQELIDKGLTPPFEPVCDRNKLN